MVCSAAYLALCPSDPDIAPYGGGIWLSQICAEQLFHSPDESPRAPRAGTGKATRGWPVVLVLPACSVS